LVGVERNYFVHYNSAEAPMGVITQLKVASPIWFGYPEDKQTVIRGVMDCDITVAENLPPRYWFKFEVEKWDQETQNWMDLHPSSGTMTMHYIEKSGDPETRPATLSCKVRCSIYQGDMGSPLFIERATIKMHEIISGADFSLTDRLEPRQAKHTIVFGEKVRLAVTEAYDQHTQWSVYYWEIPSTSKRFLKFTQGLDPLGNGKDDGRSIIVQALNTTTEEAEVMAKVWRYTWDAAHKVKTKAGDAYDVWFSLKIISDQVEATDWGVESPYVGCSMSTSQLYLLTNCGNQLFKNSLNDPRNLENCIVAAYMHNSFMAGGSITGSGFQPIILNDCDLGHIEFTLVDSNYKPIKLTSPMYVTLKIEPTEDPAQDISMWKGKLPKNAPTPEQKAQMEAQQRAQQEEEARKKQQMDYLTETLAKVLTNMTNQQQQLDQMQAQQQPVTQPVQQTVQQQPVEEEPPPPTDAEMVQAERDYEFEAEQGIL
jgi:hypothetical protein